MFIHFDSDKGTPCDNCSSSHTIMHMSMEHLDRSINLCLVCVGALTQALSNATPKLRVPSGWNSEILEPERLSGVHPKIRRSRV
jgi:hypothetical protein